MFAVAIWVQPSASMATENHPDVSQRVCRFGTCSLSLSRAEVYTVDCHRAVDLRGGFSPRPIFAYCRRISTVDFAAEPSFDLSKSCGGFRGGFVSGPKPCKLHINIAPEIHHKNPPHSSPHARLVCDCTLPAFFTACFAACASTGILQFCYLHGGFLRGEFLRGGFLPRRISSAADFCKLCRHTTLAFVHGCCAASGGHLS